jgi:hypothetical protein
MILDGCAVRPSVRDIRTPLARFDGSNKADEDMPFRGQRRNLSHCFGFPARYRCTEHAAALSFRGKPARQVNTMAWRPGVRGDGEQVRESIHAEHADSVDRLAYLKLVS